MPFTQPMKALTALLALLALGACGGVQRAAPPAGPPAGPNQVTELDDTRSFTFHVGEEIEVVLHQQQGFTAWSGVQSSNQSVLAPVVDTRNTAARGVTLAKFKAAATGQAEVTANAGIDCSPGAACAMVVRLWRIRVTVL